MIRLGESLLTCPHRGGVHLHLASAERFDRKDNAQDGVHVAVHTEFLTSDRTRVLVDQDLTDNPSVYRGAVVLRFYDEECGQTSELALIQHKGQTFIRWGSKRRGGAG